MAQRVKNPPASAKDAVRSASREDPLEEEMTTHSSIFAWEISQTEEPGGLHPQGCRVRRDFKTEHTNQQKFLLVSEVCNSFSSVYQTRKGKAQSPRIRS